MLGLHVLQAVRNPLHMLLNGHDDVGQHRRAAGAGDKKEVRKTRCHQAQVSTRPRHPLVLQGLATLATNVNAIQRARYCVVASGKNDAVQRMESGCCANALGNNRYDRRCLQIHQVHMRLVVGCVVVGIDADSLGADGMVGGGQQFGNCRVFDGTANFVAHEFGCIVIGFFIRVDIVESMRVIGTALGPATLVLLLALGFAHVGAGGLAVVIQNARPGGLGLFAAFGVVGFPGLLFRLRQGPVPRRNAEVGGALENHHLCGLFGNLGNALNARRASANDADTLSGEIHRLVRPTAGVVPLAFEVRQAGRVRHPRRRQTATRRDQEA